MMQALGYGVNNQQFYDQMGYNIGRDNNDDNYRYLLALLNGN